MNKEVSKLCTYALMMFCFLSFCSTAIVANWPQYGYNELNTSFSPTSAPITNKTFLIKQVDSENQGEAAGYPVFFNGKLFVGFSDGSLYCINAYNGSVFWKKNLQESYGLIYGTPAVNNNQLYVGAGSKLLCFDTETGSVKWTIETGNTIKASPTVDRGKIFVGSTDKKMYCIDENGTLIWSFTANETIFTAAACQNDKIYFSASNPLLGAFQSTSFIYCLDRDTGEKKWRYLIEGSPRATACTVVDNRVYVGCVSSLICLSAEGNGDGTTTLIAEYQIHPVSALTDITAAYGNIYFGTSYSSQNKIYCLTFNATQGELKVCWDYTFSGTTTWASASPIVADFKVYVSVKPRKFYCFDALGNDNGTSSVIWQASTGEYTANGQPIVSNGKIWVATNNKIVIGFGENNAPTQPIKPIGTTFGEINKNYIFTSKTDDPDGDLLWYQWKFDTVITEWFGPYQSNFSVQQSYSWKTSGIHTVQIRARDIYNAESDWSLPFLQVINQSISSLLVECPSEIVEGENFTVTVLVDGKPVDQASVTFLRKTYKTDIFGTIIISAPYVTRNTVFPLVVTYENYPSITKIISILNQDDSAKNHGWVFGIIYDEDHNILQNVTICINYNIGNNIERECTISKDGLYNSKPLFEGSYHIQVSKIGYYPQTQTIDIYKNTAVQLDFFLKRIDSSVQPNSLIREYINNAILEGKIGGEIIFNQTEESIYYEKLTYTDLTIGSIIYNEQQKQISLNISSEQTQSSILVIILNQETIVGSHEEISVEYDNQKILTIANNITDLLNTDIHENNPKYYITQDSDKKIHVLIFIPNFSEHTIVLKKVINLLTTPIAILIYTILSIICIIIFIVPSLYLHYPPLFYILHKRRKNK
ncbi:MAG: PQQ-binding-like beta-propeller repeat protein [Candidatus Thermoplasmatota archaeon]